ncbi:MAG: RNA methyltransferase [Verrucomicrobia bacterium]|nr:RNA methyltransferase [Verrucomicrobiota bacterium]
MEDAYIQSRHNEQIKNLVKLRERKHRERQERFLVEGLRELSHALDAGYAIECLYYCPEHFPSEAHAEFIRARRHSEQPTLIRLSSEAFEKASLREGPDGIVAVGQQQSHALAELELPKNPLLLILEGIEKPGNLGAILRSADGAGADAVILVDCVLDLYNPNAIRSSQGLLFALPLVTAEREPLKEWLAEHKIRTYATTPAATKKHWDCDYNQATALLLGSEQSGLSDSWIQNADQTILIPMAGQADSLNVAATAAVCLYEARRQRQSHSN